MPVQWPWASITNPPAIPSGTLANTNATAYKTYLDGLYLAIGGTATAATTAAGGWPVQWPVASITNLPASVVTNYSQIAGSVTTTVNSILSNANNYNGTFTGNGSGLTNLFATNIVGSITSPFPTNHVSPVLFQVGTLWGTTNVFIQCVYTNQ